MATKWKQFKLLDIATVSDHRVSHFTGEKDYVATGDIELNKITGNQRVNYENRPSRADLIMDENDVLFAKMKDTVKVLVGSKDTENKIFSTGFYVLTPNKDVAKEFLYFYFLSVDFNRQKNLLCTGATMSGLNNVGLRKITLQLPVKNDGTPDLAEQKRIVATLEEAESLKKKRAEADQKMDDLIPALFMQMFGNSARNEKGWNTAELGSLCETIYRYPTFYGFEYSDSGIPVARIGNIIDPGVLDPDLSHYMFISPEINKRFPRTILELLDIVMAVRGDGSTGKRIGLVTSENLVGANMSPNLLRFKTNANELNPIYLFHLMTSGPGQALIDKRITRTAKKTITSKDNVKIDIPTPPIALQNQFADKVKEIAMQKEKQKQSAIQLDGLFSSLLSRSFASKT